MKRGLERQIGLEQGRSGRAVLQVGRPGYCLLKKTVGSVRGDVFSHRSKVGPVTLGTEGWGLEVDGLGEVWRPRGKSALAVSLNPSVWEEPQAG